MERIDQANDLKTIHTNIYIYAQVCTYTCLKLKQEDRSSRFMPDLPQLCYVFLSTASHLASAYNWKIKKPFCWHASTSFKFPVSVSVQGAVRNSVLCLRLRLANLAQFRPFLLLLMCGKRNEQTFRHEVAIEG